ncbi:MAG: hypothetical protein V2I43_16560 [Parvularcula sp.]|jgi:hypothetical protein|nr:hypothetical protein [Parvularcula sp.]
MTERNFHGIGAIVFALRYGFLGVPTFLRLAWLPLIAGAILFYFLVEAGGNVAFGGANSGFGSGGAEISVSQGFMVTADTWTLELIILALLMVGAAILTVPALAAVTREAAGHPPRGGFLPVFGRKERAYLGALAVLLILMIIAAGAAVTLVSLAAKVAIPLAVLVGLIAGSVIIFGLVRICLFPTHAAVTGRIAPFEAASLTQGVFFKLLGTFILTVVIFWAIGLGVGILGLALGTLGGAILAQLPGALLQLYNNLANTGLTGRIFSDLNGFPPKKEASTNATSDPLS